MDPELVHIVSGAMKPMRLGRSGCILMRPIDIDTKYPTAKTFDDKHNALMPAMGASTSRVSLCFLLIITWRKNFK
jgi:hypothetical protein